MVGVISVWMDRFHASRVGSLTKVGRVGTPMPSGSGKLPLAGMAGNVKPGGPGATVPPGKGRGCVILNTAAALLTAFRFCETCVGKENVRTSPYVSPDQPCPKTRP